MKNQITYFRFIESAKDSSHSSLIDDVKTLKELNNKHKNSKDSLDLNKKGIAKIPLDELNKFNEIFDTLFKNLDSIKAIAKIQGYNRHKYTDYVLSYVSDKKSISELTDDMKINPSSHKYYHVTPEEYISSRKMENKYILDAVNELKSNIGRDVINNFEDYQKVKESYENSLKDYNELKEELSNFKFQERINVKDMESLNKIIEDMNNKGWSVKQIEGILSGHSGHIYDGGFGYGFTEGIMILWEMK